MQIDTIIVGGGATGSAAAWQLARRGVSVTVFERAADPRATSVAPAAGLDAGSAVGAGPSSFVSTVHAEPVRLRLLTESLRLWHELEPERDRNRHPEPEHHRVQIGDRTPAQPLLDVVGGLRHGSDAELDELHRVMARFGFDSEILQPAQAEARWPGFRADSRVLHTPQSARVDSAAAAEALRSAAVAAGAEFRFGERVTRLRVLGDDRAMVEVVAQDASGEPIGEPREFECRRLVVTLGAWTSKLLGSVLVLPRLQVTQVQTVRFRHGQSTGGSAATSAAPLAGSRSPVIAHRRPPHDARYGYWRSPWLLAVPGPHGIDAEWLGAGPVSGGPLTDPDARPVRPNRHNPSALRRYVREWLPEFDPEVEEGSIRYSLHTVARDGQFVIDRVGPVSVAVGFSDHGLTFAPGAGALLADLTEGIRAPAAFSLRPERRQAPSEDDGGSHGGDHGAKQTVNKAHLF